MIDKVTSAICDAPLGSLYVAVNVCAEPLVDDGVTETGDAVPRVAVLVFKHPLRNRVQQRIKVRRTLELLNRSETQTCEYRYTESSKADSMAALYQVVQSPEIARHWNGPAGLVTVQRAAGVKEQ
jgi:hypothetical protein